MYLATSVLYCPPSSLSAAGLFRTDTAGKLMSPSALKRRGLQVGACPSPSPSPCPPAHLPPAEAQLVCLLACLRSALCHCLAFSAWRHWLLPLSALLELHHCRLLQHYCYPLYTTAACSIAAACSRARLPAAGCRLPQDVHGCADAPPRHCWQQPIPPDPGRGTAAPAGHPQAHGGAAGGACA